MKNIKIEKTENHTYIVRATTDRFGENEIMYESFNVEDCRKYIISTLVLIYKMSKTPALIGEIIKWMPEKKKAVLANAAYRNNLMTSEYGLEHVQTLEHREKHGLYIEMSGCRSGFAVYITDSGEIKRAPNTKDMTKIKWFPSCNCNINWDDIATKKH